MALQRPMSCPNRNYVLRDMVEKESEDIQADLLTWPWTGG